MGESFEAELVRDASGGDARAIELLLAQQLPGLEAFLRRRGVGLPLQKESASDLAQSVCREVLERLSTGRLEYLGPDAFRAWLYEAALLKIKGRLRHWRAERRDPAREAQALDGPLGGASGTGLGGEVSGGAPSPSSEAALREELERARRLMDALPERYREIIRLARLEGLGHAEIAERMGIQEATSRMLLSRALARLATLAEREP